MSSKQTYSNSTGLSFNCEVNEDHKSFVITARIRNTIVGMYRYSQINDDQSHHWVMVDTEYQGLGLGTVLVLHAIDQANYLGHGYSTDARGYSNDLDAVYKKLARLGLVNEYSGYLELTDLGKKVLHK